MSHHRQVLYLRITNPEVIEFGSPPTFNFDRMGGTIGSKGSNWLLQDYSGEIAPVHAEITLRDNHYCLIDRSGRTRINDHHDSIGLNRIIQLSSGDALTIGKYKIKVRLHDIEAANIRNHGETPKPRPVGQLIDRRPADGRVRNMITSCVGDDTPNRLQPVAVQRPEDLVLINETPRQVMDPLAAFSLGADHSEQVKAPLNAGTAQISGIGDTPNMTKDTVDSEDPHWSETYHPHGRDAQLDHVVIAPLLRGMGVTDARMDSEQAHDFLVDAGRSIRCAIEGIQALYARDRKTLPSPTLLTRNLQPIEDNPLRLQQSYQETVDALFSTRRSRVHLSPPAAIEEGLDQLQHHQSAVIVAIQESLAALLQALSPEVLNHRFQRYSSSGHNGEDHSDWSWDMYKEYYSELVSSRQTGFEKLFWEVFEQAYDRAMRRSFHPQAAGSNQNEQ